MSKNNLILQVKFTKYGNKIKFMLPVRMFCDRMQNEISHTMTLNKNDQLFKHWLGNNIDDIFKNRKTIYKKVCLNYLYDYCDKPKSL